MSLAENIARLRKAKGLTQAELGNYLGVSNQAVSKWENGVTMPDVMLLPNLADVFGCHIDELFSREVKTEIHYTRIFLSIPITQRRTTIGASIIN